MDQISLVNAFPNKFPTFGISYFVQVTEYLFNFLIRSNIFNVNWFSFFWNSFDHGARKESALCLAIKAQSHYLEVHFKVT